MAKRSLQASDEGIRKAKQAFKRKGWTQEYLAGEVGLETRQPIWKFFTGKPIDRHVFNDICSALELDVSEIAQQPTVEDFEPYDVIEQTKLDIDLLVQKLRSIHYERIQAQCGTLHLLDITKPIGLNDIYIDVNFVEEITSKRWLELTDLQSLDHDYSNQFTLNKIYQEKIQGIEAVTKYSKMIVLGKPGSGKTTFLQSIAISCNEGFLKPDYLPIFISLKNFAEDAREHPQISLLNYLHEYFISFRISESDMIAVLNHGKTLFLLDGLDEIIGENADQIFQKIRSFAEKFYKNQIIITCRTAFQEYKLQGFTEVEIAYFTKPQIAKFVNKWFLKVANNSALEAQKLAKKFMQKIQTPENSKILELATTPILLNLTCLIFQSLEDFPTNHYELYKQALDLLLIHWDEARHIKRVQAYRNLSLLYKIKLLSHIAAISFTKGDYFLPEAQIQQLIAEYICQLPNAITDADALEIESVAVLKAIEVQHGLLIERARGIYSFSHLIFQEYFTAREIVTNANSQILQNLVNHLSEKRWREVFLLSVGMLKSADELLDLIKRKIDDLIYQNAKLHDFMKWVNQKAATANSFYDLASVRIFYFTIALPPENPLACNQDLAISLDRRIAGNLAANLALDLALTHTLAVSLSITDEIFFQRIYALSLALDVRYLLVDKLFLKESLQDLKNQLPDFNQERDVLKIWWQNHGKAWTEKLRTLMIDNRQIGYNWHFDQQELLCLQQYWDANKLLLDCLNSAFNVTAEMRSSIEQSLFLVKTESLVD